MNSKVRHFYIRVTLIGMALFWSGFAWAAAWDHVHR